MRKIGFMVMTLFVALGIMGAAYGSWAHTLNVEGEVQTLGAPMILKVQSSDDNYGRTSDPDATSPGTWGPAGNADIPRWTHGTYVKDSLGNTCVSAKTTVPFAGPTNWRGSGFTSSFSFDVQADYASYGQMGQFKNGRYGGSVALSIHNPNDVPLTISEITAVVTSASDPSKTYFCTSSGGGPVLGGALGGTVVIPANESRIGWAFITVDGTIPHDENYQITVTFVTRT